MIKRKKYKMAAMLFCASTLVSTATYTYAADQCTISAQIKCALGMTEWCTRCQER